MERHFALPITIAAALHAGLLFGINTSRCKTVADVLMPPTVPCGPLIEFILAPPDSSDETTERTKSAPSDPPPVLPEPLPAARPEGFVLAIPHEQPRALAGEKPVFNLHPPGNENGGGTGLGFDPPAVVPIDRLDATPRARLQVAPQYPFAERREGTHGEVFVEFVVDETGVVLSPRVVHSSNRAFEEPTLRAVAKWRFEPGRRDGRVVRFRMAVPVFFKLDRE